MCSRLVHNGFPDADPVPGRFYLAMWRYGQRHHRAKQAPGWHLAQPEPGVLIWTTPSGRTYAAHPDTYPR